MAMEELKKTCEECGYSWFPEIDDMVECPKCKYRLDVETKKETYADLKTEIEILKKDADALRENLKELNLGSYQS